MKWYRGPEGDQRIWYDAADIEQIAEDELRKASLMPSLTAPVADIETFIESHLGIELDQYADLPRDVLGLTTFHANRPPVIQISRELTDRADDVDPLSGIAGRWRATMAHEAMHVLLHRYLFDPKLAEMVLGVGAAQGVTNGGLTRCSETDVTSAGAGELERSQRRSDWREVQANMGMAALLMPARLFKRLASQKMSNLGIGRPDQGSDEAAVLGGAVASACQVSKQAAGIRLQTLKVLSTRSVDH